MLRRRAGASSATLLVHLEPPERQSLLIASDGDGEIVPELADEERAWKLIAAHAENQEADLERLTAIPSEKPGAMLVRVAFGTILARASSQRRSVNERRSEPDIQTAPATDGAIWLGLTDCADASLITRALEPIDLTGEQFPPPEDDSGWLNLFTSLAARFAWSTYHLTGSLQDPVSQLGGRMEFQVFLKRAIAAARHHRQAVSLLLVNPDNFNMVNHRYGRERGDLTVREIADELTTCLRKTDGVFRYGGAVFGAVLPATDIQQCRAAAEKVRRVLSGHRYVGESEHLTFSIGAAVASADDLNTKSVQATDLLKRADGALNRAKLTGGARALVTELGNDDDASIGLDPLTGIFTADTEKDYRNMLLLWETVGLVSSHPDPTTMACAFVDRLSIGFQPDRMVLLSVDEDDTLTPMATNVRDNKATDGRTSGREVILDEQRGELITRALQSKHVERLQRHSTDSTTGFTGYAVPLISRDEAIGCLFLDGDGRRLQLDSSDVIFLNALAAQMAEALDRAHYAAQWIREKDRESRQLREELQELRQAVPKTTMVYESNEMRALIDTIGRVAPTNATVLIIGESGTGKEMLAQTIHEQSKRRDGAFIVFDCGAVAHTLLEAELFGHIKGAFTGAESASEGRIAQADNGTLFLDEIGELPLQVQAKLLRFVQEKEFSPVGSGTTRKVDVRIVAATNRELQKEVAAGRFRADLYYRLQVIALQAVPLRHRTSDIIPLARYFLDNSCVQNGLSPKQLTRDAEHRLLDHPWPGNVRELQHCMLRAVLTAPTDEIDAHSIELLPDATIDSDVSESPDYRPLPQIHTPPAPAPAPAPDGHHTNAVTPTAPWASLRTELKNQIERAMAQNGTRPVPLGRWLTEDLVMEAGAVSDNVARRAARLVGVPESTFRRQYQKATAEREVGLAQRTAEWQRLVPLIGDIVADAKSNPDGESDLIEQARRVLLDDVASSVADQHSVGAALMGVTVPTYKRWVEAQRVH